MRVARAVASALTLAALTVGVFFALLTFGRLPGWDELADLPGEMLTDRTAFALLTLLAWAAWAVFTGTVAVELVGELTGNQRWRLPAGTPFQATARRLVAAITMSATLSGPLLARSGPAPTLAAAAAAETADIVHTPSAVHAQVSVAPPTPNQPSIDRHVTAVAPASPPATPQPPAADQLPAVTVAVGDTPWGIAERHLGRGIRWREIWNLNRGVPQPDGRAWITEDLIHPGWRLRLPADAVGVNPPAAPTTPAPAGSDAPDQPAQTDAPAPAPPDAEDSTPGHGTAPADAGQHDQAQPSRDPAACDPERLPSGSDGSASTTPETPPPDGQIATPETPGTDDSDEAIHHEDETDDAISGLAVLAGISGATVTATGLAFQIRRRRRRRTAKTATTAWAPDDPDDVSTEQAVAAASDLPLVQWAGHHLAALVDHPPGRINGGPQAVELSPETGIELLWDTPNPTARAPWVPADGGWAWRLSYDPDAPVPLNDQPAGIPGLVTVGHRDGRQLLIDLEAFGAIALAGDPERIADLARSIAVELGASEELASAQVILAGLDITGAALLPRIRTETADEALTRLRGTVAAIHDALERSYSPSTFDYRTGEAWTDVTTVLVPDSDAVARALVEASPPRRGVATIVVGPDVDTPARLTVQPDGTAQLEPLGITFHAAGLPAESATDVAHLLDALDQPTTADAASDSTPEQLHLPTAATSAGANGADESPHNDGPVDHTLATDAIERATDETSGPDQEEGAGQDGTDADEPVWPQLLVKVLGRPHVPARPNLKRRELALVAYLASKGQPTPAASVQHAVWGGRAVQTKTIWNLAYATRSALGSLDDGTPAMLPSQRAHNTLAVAPGVRTDLQLLQDLYDSAQHASAVQAMELLQQGLDLIEGQPFDGPDFEWAHHTELLVAQATRLIENATEHLVELATGAGRTDLARHAITQGLRALPGNEVLYRARMTVEHDDGNLAGVRAAYEELVSYLADIDAEPSQATINLYRQLRPRPGRHAS